MTRLPLTAIGTFVELPLSRRSYIYFQSPNSMQVVFVIEKINKSSLLLVLRAFFALALMCSLSFAIGSLSVSPFSPSAGGAYGSQSNFATPATLPISAYAAPGYSFTSWVKNGNCTLYNMYAPNTTITVNSGSCSVTAFFALTNSARASLTVSSSNPSATKKPPQAE